MDWVTLETFWSLEEAQLAVAYLQSHQVPCRLDGTAVAGNFWHLSNATGGVKLMVAPADAQRAAQLLYDVEAHRGEPPKTDTIEEQPASDNSPAEEREEDVDSEIDSPDPYDDKDDDDKEYPDDYYRPTFLSQLRDQRGWLLLVIFWPAVIFVFGVLMMILGRIVS